jgi:hypothetical protein
MKHTLIGVREVESYFLHIIIHTYIHIYIYIYIMIYKLWVSECHQVIEI